MGVNGLIDWRVESGGEREFLCFSIVKFVKRSKSGLAHNTCDLYTAGV